MVLAEYIFGDERVMVSMYFMLIQVYVMAGFCYWL